MLPQLLATVMLMRRRPLEYRANAFTAGGGTTITKPAGVEVGDLVVVWAIDISSGATLTTTSGSAWSKQSVSPAIAFWKILDATDVANAWTLSSAAADGAQALRYRGNGTTAATVKATTSNGGGNSTLTLSGFAKAAGHRGVIALYSQYSGDPSAGDGATIAVPSGFTERRRDYSTGDFFAALIADRLGGYVDGASVQFTGANTGPNKVGVLLEVTGT